MKKKSVGVRTCSKEEEADPELFQMNVDELTCALRNEHMLLWECIQFLQKIEEQYSRDELTVAHLHRAVHSLFVSAKKHLEKQSPWDSKAIDELLYTFKERCNDEVKKGVQAISKVRKVMN